MRFTAPAAQAALVGILTAALPDVAVQDGLPVDRDAIPNVTDRVYINDDPVNIARKQFSEQGTRVETYEIELVVECQDIAVRDRQPVKTRLWALLDEIDDAIEANDTLTGVVRGSTLATIPTVTTAPLPEGWLASARCRVVVQSLVL